MSALSVFLNATIQNLQVATSSEIADTNMTEVATTGSRNTGDGYLTHDDARERASGDVVTFSDSLKDQTLSEAIQAVKDGKLGMKDFYDKLSKYKYLHEDELTEILTLISQHLKDDNFKDIAGTAQASTSAKIGQLNALMQESQAVLETLIKTGQSTVQNDTTAATPATQGCEALNQAYATAWQLLAEV